MIGTTGFFAQLTTFSPYITAPLLATLTGFSEANQMAVDNGILYIVDTGNSKLHRYDLQNSQQLSSLNVPAQAAYLPRAICFAGDELFIGHDSPIGAYKYQTIKVFDKNTLAYIREFGQVSQCWCLQFAENRILAASYGHTESQFNGGEMRVYDLAGTLLKDVRLPSGNMNYIYTLPTGIAYMARFNADYTWYNNIKNNADTTRTASANVFGSGTGYGAYDATTGLVFFTYRAARTNDSIGLANVAGTARYTGALTENLRGVASWNGSHYAVSAGGKLFRIIITA